MVGSLFGPAWASSSSQQSSLHGLTCVRGQCVAEVLTEPNSVIPGQGQPAVVATLQGMRLMPLTMSLTCLARSCYPHLLSLWLPCGLASTWLSSFAAAIPLSHDWYCEWLYNGQSVCPAWTTTWTRSTAAVATPQGMRMVIKTSHIEQYLFVAGPVAKADACGLSWRLLSSLCDPMSLWRPCELLSSWLSQVLWLADVRRPGSASTAAAFCVVPALLALAGAYAVLVQPAHSPLSRLSA
jgi:hypothetical protein